MFRLKKCHLAESNRRHKDFQSFALPTELRGRFYLKFNVNIIFCGRKNQVSSKFFNFSISKGFGFTPLKRDFFDNA